MPKALSLPDVKVGRCSFPRQFRHMTTFNAAEIVPLMYDCNITPGDTVQIPISAVVRMQTPLYPVMDDLVLDVSCWFVPDRLTWVHLKQFWGENDTTFWEQPSTYAIPQIKAPATTGWAEYSLADYLGIPTGIADYETSAMPIRAYCMIWNEFFRDENLKEPCFFATDDTKITGVNKDVNFDYTTDIGKGACLMKAAKLPDYFTKSLPEPLKHDDIYINAANDLPVITGNNHNDVLGNKPLRYVFTRNGTDVTIPTNTTVIPQGLVNYTSGINVPGATQDPRPWSTNAPLNMERIRLGTPDGNNEINAVWSQPVNLWASASNLGITVNNLRLAIQLQRFYELQARSGSRYIETLASVFGVKSSDARLQRPEYLGGKRYPIVMSQVLSNAEGANTRVGSVGGMSQTVINDYLCTKSFEEHGTLMVLGVIRQLTHTYQQGCPKMLLRKNQFDFYNRALDHIGETAVLNQEIYAQGPAAINASTGKAYDEEVFGYQPAFEDMRLGWKYVTGEMRSNVANSLDVWNYADDYNALPTLSSSWIDETEINVDRTLSVPSSTSNQIFADFCFNTVYTRGMSAYGTPGFMDHM